MTVKTTARIKRLLSPVAAVFCAVLLAVPALAAGSVTVTYNNGGTITNIVGQVSVENGVIYVQDDNPVSFDIVPDEGYQIYGVYLNEQSMGAAYTGEGTKTVSVSPNGADVRVRVTFRSDSAMNAPDTTTTQTPDTSATEPSTTQPTESQTPETPSDNNTTASQPQTEPEAPTIGQTDNNADDDNIDADNDAANNESAPDDDTIVDDIIDDIENDSDTQEADDTKTSAQEVADSLLGVDISNGGVGGYNETESKDIDMAKVGVGAAIAAAAVAAAAVVVSFIRRRG